MSPFFTIIIPTYNRANLLPRAIQSVLNQTFEDWEMIIVDDGSTDETSKVVVLNNDLRIKYFRQKNGGRGSARNQGVNRASGQYLCFLDDDDYYLPEFLSSIYRVVSVTDYNLIKCGAYWEKDERQKEDFFLSNETPLWRSVYSCGLSPAQSSVKMAAIENIRFKEIQFAQDLDFFFQVLLIDLTSFYEVGKYLTVLSEHDSRSHLTIEDVVIHVKEYRDRRSIVESFESALQSKYGYSLSRKLRLKRMSIDLRLVCSKLYRVKSFRVVPYFLKYLSCVTVLQYLKVLKSPL